MDTKFSAAVHILILASESPSPLNSDQIALSVGTNPSYVRKVLALLKRAGIVDGHRGVSGYNLTADPRQLTLLEIYQAVMEEEQPHLLDIHQNPSDQCVVGRHIRPLLSGMFGDVEEAFAHALAGRTLADCVAAVRKEIEAEPQNQIQEDLIMNVVEIIFSPTGGTEKVARIISKQWTDRPQTIDLSDPKTDFAKCEISADDMVLIAMPSFGGLAPAPAVERLKQISGNGAKAVLACVYGNRAYEDTLVHMEDAARACGFQVVAAVSAVAEHSILPQYATGRPDADDEKQLAGFAEKIAAKEGAVSSIPGNRPHKKPGGAGMVPKPDKACAKCGACAKSCPAQAIDGADFEADAKKCISCMRCVKVCPSKARKLNGLMVSAAAMALKKACSVRKENELFL